MPSHRSYAESAPSLLSSVLLVVTTGVGGCVDSSLIALCSFCAGSDRIDGGSCLMGMCLVGLRFTVARYSHVCIISAVCAIQMLSSNFGFCLSPKLSNAISSRNSALKARCCGKCNMKNPVPALTGFVAFGSLLVYVPSHRLTIVCIICSLAACGLRCFCTRVFR